MSLPFSYKRHVPPWRRHLAMWVVLLSMLSLTACSLPQRTLNLFRIPQTVQTLHALDSMATWPKVVSITSDFESGSFELERGLAVRGNPLHRTTFMVGDDPSFRVRNGETLVFSDVNWLQTMSEPAALQIDSGTVVLTNVDFTGQGIHAIQLGAHGNLRLENVRFEGPGIHSCGPDLSLQNVVFTKTHGAAIKADAFDHIAIRAVEISQSSGNAIHLEGDGHILMDSVRIVRPEASGVVIQGASQVRMKSIDLSRPRGDGVVLDSIGMAVLENVEVLGSGGSGVFVRTAESLKIDNSSLVQSDANGLALFNVKTIHMTGIRALNNILNGVLATRVDSFWIQSSHFQGNSAWGVSSSQIDYSACRNVLAAHNGMGMRFTSFDQLDLNAVEVLQKGATCLDFQEGNHAVLKHLVLEGADVGAQALGVVALDIQSSRLSQNKEGLNLRDVASFTSRRNLFAANVTGMSAHDMTTFLSEQDTITDSRDTGFELMDGGEVIIQKGRFHGNRQALNVVHSSCRIEDSELIKSRIRALSARNVHLSIYNTRFLDNALGVDLEGSKTEIVQSALKRHITALKVGEGSTLLVANSLLEDLKSGVLLHDFSHFEMVNSQVSEVDGYVLSVMGSVVDQLAVSHSLVQKAGGFLNGAAKNGALNIHDNTFSRIITTFAWTGIPFHALQNNIFYESGMPGNLLQLSPVNVSNCYPETLEVDEETEVFRENLFADPRFAEGFYLQPDSPCLGADGNPRMGARGLRPKLKPELQP